MSQPSSRRSFLRRLTGGVLWTGLTGGGGSYAYARLIERHQPVVERVQVPLRGLGSAFDGFRIVQISDLHVEPNRDPQLLSKSVQLINNLRPDLVALTGDYVTSNASHLARLTEPLASLKAKAGVVASMGNHDVWTAASRIEQTLQEHGLQLLRNRGFALTRQGESLWIAGLDSIWGGRPNIPDALRGKPARTPCIALMHEPDYADVLSQARVNALQLSGHTHGGQVCLPLGVPLRLPSWGKKYPKGLFQVGRLSLYVNRGLGTLGPKARFACPPEITEITLSCA